MAYERINFKTGQVLTADALNHMEDGIAMAMKGGGVTATTYAELKALRDAGQLKAGAFYRITDYMTTTTQENTQSAGHAFDLIVLALNERTLCEEAKAVVHEGDTYFTEAGANLAAWKVWYCLDNDAKRFTWALRDDEERIYAMPVGHTRDLPDEAKGTMLLKAYEDDGDLSGNKILYMYELLDGTQLYFTESRDIYNEAGRDIGEYTIIKGKGVIYRMIDEWGNDCPYDFKNIRFVVNVYDDYSIAIDGDSDIRIYAHTFSWAQESKEAIDASIFGNNGAMNIEAGNHFGVMYNSIKPYYLEALDVHDSPTQLLVHNIFHNTYNHDAWIFYGNRFNSIGYNSIGNLFGDGCHNNIVGNHCKDNYFKADSCMNTIGNYCEGNTMGYVCESNVIMSRITYCDLVDDSKYVTVGFDSTGEVVQKNLFDE